MVGVGAGVSGAGGVTHEPLLQVWPVAQSESELQVVGVAAASPDRLTTVASPVFCICGLVELITSCTPLSMSERKSLVTESNRLSMKNDLGWLAFAMAARWLRES